MRTYFFVVSFANHSTILSPSCSGLELVGNCEWLGFFHFCIADNDTNKNSNKQDQGWNHFSSHFPSFPYFFLSFFFFPFGLSYRIDALLISISVSCPSLEEVRLRVARLISDTGLSSLSSLCHLHILDVGRCDSITNEGLCPILLNCSSITFLDVSWCLVDDAFCQKLGSALHKIQNIVIEGCKSITNDGIISLVHSCPLLQR